jgi:hypothetical protein
MVRTIAFMSLLMAIITALSSVPSYAFTMVDYWSFNEGNVWVYDRDLQVLGTETHEFGGYTGRPFLQAREFYNNHPYIYSGPEGVMAVGMFIFDTKQFVDLSATPIKVSNAEMNIGESVTTNIPAGVIDDNAISITITLEGVETVSVPAGTFNDALRVKAFINDGVGTYTERIWLAKGVGAVQMYRVSETNNTHGCFWTCGSLSGCGSNVVEERYIKLQSFIKRQKKTVVIPFGD